MSISEQLSKLNEKKQKIDRKIDIVENRNKLKSARERNKSNRKKKFLAKNWFSSIHQHIILLVIILVSRVWYWYDIKVGMLGFDMKIYCAQGLFSH